MKHSAKKRWKWPIIFFIPLFFLVLIIIWPVDRARLEHNQIQSCRIYDVHGILLREILSFDEGYGTWIALDTLPEHVTMAFLAAEDKRFYSHWGIDLQAIARAFWLNIRKRRIVSGGSTITQQLARRLYHLPRTWYAKPIEALLAFRLEIRLGKNKIFEHYLNRVPFGNQTFGIEAASRLYFDKPAAHLSVAEAAFLAALPQAPGRLNPYTHFSRAKRRQETILSLMQKSAFVDSATVASARETRLNIVPAQKNFRAPHFCRMILNRYGQKLPPEITTTLDYPLQHRIETLVLGHIERLKNHHATNAAVIVIENETGAVRAWIGSKDFFDAEHSGQVDGVLALRQPGSTLKPFTYGLALENGFTPATIIPDLESHASTANGDFFVRNYDGNFHGPVRLRTALACSYNVPTVRVLKTFGAGALLNRLKKAGISSLNKEPNFYGLGLTLGDGEVSLTELANAYAALARGGQYVPLKFTLDASEGAKKKGEIDTQKASEVFSPQICFLLTDILSDPVARTPAFGMAGPLRLPFQCAAKTGTSKDFRDNWTVGYTTKYTVGVWVGNFDGQPMHNVSGISGAGPLFHDIMLVLHEKEMPKKFTPPPGLRRIRICASSGQLPGIYCKNIIREWFIAGQEPEQTCTVHQAVEVDTRNNLLATPETPMPYRKKIIYEIWPPIYTSWMAERGLPAVPHAYSSLSNGDTVRLAVTFPDDGDVFKIDPVLRREFQTIQLQASVPQNIDSVQWLIDDHLLATVRSPFTLQWSLQRGKHKVQIRAMIGGENVKSPPVLFQVF